MNILISNTSGEPIYAQIVSQIRQMILQGELVSGTPLPSIRLLAKELQISVITTKRAYEELEREGLINSIVGKGSFVSGADQEFIREQRLRIMENKMKEIIDESKMLGINFAEFSEMLKLLYEEETE
ncbi:GntR family transcriptional regulator [Paenibacillus sp. FSL R7-0048]|jgi:GntR family transcriptional regulator|uniref:GntR family transcriptional regulator n=1 Tax=Paenibacillus odorifer TaxID=189426 RepID=A0A1R0XT01_9BACL|nr:MULTISPECIES: GntR family transcriptional regulator [Paenibacillus]AWV33969.1 GntR family transcriptional regulator [Paenibacillus odorifer]MDH6430522.1 GntR family transcriptional regulator [Paenibacillus sp. PastH-4]MDH6443732.1 GntR family transcriptional regulator [Paenibacillus sp. PastF-4]MDH6527640.1 GntR family transcriptional regulator [Paenibacillus sp. PastH-3]OMC70024.1 GntR family transcriptional regulator [Paenibacillus odorifer]